MSLTTAGRDRARESQRKPFGKEKGSTRKIVLSSSIGPWEVTSSAGERKQPKKVSGRSDESKGRQTKKRRETFSPFYLCLDILFSTPQP